MKRIMPRLLNSCCYLAVLLILTAPFTLHAEENAEWDYVYLASFPRSGNHWVRFLIEEGTHIATSSAHKDPDYPDLEGLFPWGAYSTNCGYCGTCRYPVRGEAVVIKTHYPYFSRPIQPIYRAVICLIRHPIDAFYSFYIYRMQFRKKQIQSSKMPTKMVDLFIKKWRQFYDFWEKQPGVLFVRYEDLHREPVSCLKQILLKTGYCVTSEDLLRAVDQHPPQGKLLKHLKHYEQEDLRKIQSELGDKLLQYGYSI